MEKTPPPGAGELGPIPRGGKVGEASPGELVVILLCGEEGGQTSAATDGSASTNAIGIGGERRVAASAVIRGGSGEVASTPSSA